MQYYNTHLDCKLVLVHHAGALKLALRICDRTHAQRLKPKSLGPVTMGAAE